MKTWMDIGFEVEITADQSPSLRLLESVDPTKFRGESMHHSGGAWTETELIYGRPAAELLKIKPQGLRILIVGLGLGYIEMTLARECLKAGLGAGAYERIYSYESVPELREFFVQWVQDDFSQMAEEVRKTFDDVANHVISETSISASELKGFLRHHYKSIEDTHGALPPAEELPSGIHAVYYDAFSAKTTPYLWEESYLDQVLQKIAAQLCLFTTYACRVSLTAALEKNDFEVQVRPGFKSKRNSTLAWKRNSKKN